MDSKYAFVAYTEDIMSGDVNAKGKMVNLNEPSFKGQIDLVSIGEYKKLMEDFPDRIKGKVIGEKNLINMINYCYGELRDSAIRLAQNDADIKRRLEYFEGEFMRDGILKPDHDDMSSVMDLANKYTNFQWKVRAAQAKERQKGKGRGK